MIYERPLCAMHGKRAETKKAHLPLPQINYIFNKLNLTKRFDGPLLTLEDDHYVLPDLLYMLKFVHAENR